jgi:hypothetical protein
MMEMRGCLSAEEQISGQCGHLRTRWGGVPHPDRPDPLSPGAPGKELPGALQLAYTHKGISR